MSLLIDQITRNKISKSFAVLIAKQIILLQELRYTIRKFS